MYVLKNGAIYGRVSDTGNVDTDFVRVDLNADNFTVLGQKFKDGAGNTYTATMSDIDPTYLPDNIVFTEDFSKKLFSGQWSIRINLQLFAQLIGASGWPDVDMMFMPTAIDNNNLAYASFPLVLAADWPLLMFTIGHYQGGNQATLTNPGALTVLTSSNQCYYTIQGTVASSVLSLSCDGTKTYNTEVPTPSQTGDSFQCYLSAI